MGRRPLTARFMPGVHVFPGGVHEKEDLKFCRIFNLKENKNVNKKKLKTRSIRHTNSILLTAIRETAEETGLYLAKQTKFNTIKNISCGTWKEFLKKSYVPKVEKLIFFGRAITPSSLKIRFHARFFIAFFEDFLGELKTNGELENLEWLSLQDAKKKNIADVTEFMINEIVKIDYNYSSLLKKKSFPMFTWKNKKRWIKWDKT